jgi:ABC-type dipeptide/oligopeptide/nickel transport system ATPase subunit
MQLLIENKKSTEIFKRKVKVIKRHFKNSQHPLRMLADLFADELQKIQESETKSHASEMGSSRPEDLTRSMMRNGNNFRSQIKLSDRERESENLNLKKQKKF